MVPKNHRRGEKGDRVPHLHPEYKEKPMLGNLCNAFAPKTYVYFVYYDYWDKDGKTGTGNGEIEASGEIREISDIRKLEMLILHARPSYNSIIISNYILLRTE